MTSTDFISWNEIWYDIIQVMIWDMIYFGSHLKDNFLIIGLFKFLHNVIGTEVGLLGGFVILFSCKSGMFIRACLQIMWWKMYWIIVGKIKIIVIIVIEKSLFRNNTCSTYSKIVFSCTAEALNLKAIILNFFLCISYSKLKFCFQRVFIISLCLAVWYQLYIEAS